MAYSKIKNKFSSKDIKYISKDFGSFKNQLMEFSETYFPQNFNDFSEGNPGMMFMEMAAYVGDVLSFYADTQLQESFLSLAQDRISIYNLAHAMGYRPKTSAAASATLDVSHLVPSKLDSNGSYVPDTDYALNVLAKSTFISHEGPTFYLAEDVNFQSTASLGNTINAYSESIYQYDSLGNPEYYLLKKSARAISGEVKTQNFTVGSATKFQTLTLFDTNVLSIESIIDSDGNEYYEVPYLAQDTVFEAVSNIAAEDPELHQYSNETPYLMKLREVPRRFISRVKHNKQIEIQFGAGTSTVSDEEIIPNPDNIGLGIKDGRSKLDQAIDPSNFLHTKAYGKAPSNTTLTVRYLVGGGLQSNVSSNTITKKGTIYQGYKPNLQPGMRNFVISTIAANNPKAATGGGAGDTVEDVRLNTIANFSSQKRTVTREDYIVRALSMPARFGGVAKAYVVQDDQISPLTSEPGRIPNPLALNLYTLGYDNLGKLTTLNPATKQNLATYLEQHRVLTDAINIKDAFVINLGLEFKITTFQNVNNNGVLLNCITELQHYFNITKWQINQPIIINDIANVIGAVSGVQTVDDIEFSNKTGESNGYSKYSYSLKAATRNGIIYPSMDPTIFEIKYPNADIKGSVTTY